jgi:hypothetical protein
VVGVVHQPRRVDARSTGERGQHLGVHRGPPYRRQRLLHGPAQQLVPERDAASGIGQHATREALLDGRGARTEQRRLGVRRHDRHQSRHVARGRRQGGQPGQHEVAHRRRDALVRRGQHLGHE